MLSIFIHQHVQACTGQIDSQTPSKTSVSTHGSTADHGWSPHGSPGFAAAAVPPTHQVEEQRTLLRPGDRVRGLVGPHGGAVSIGRVGRCVDGWVVWPSVAVEGRGRPRI